MGLAEAGAGQRELLTAVRVTGLEAWQALLGLDRLVDGLDLVLKGLEVGGDLVGALVRGLLSVLQDLDAGAEGLAHRLGHLRGQAGVGRAAVRRGVEEDAMLHGVSH